MTSKKERKGDREGGGKPKKAASEGKRKEKAAALGEF